MSKPPRAIEPRYPLIQKGDKLVFDISEMVTQELEYKYITNKKVQFAVFPAVNIDNQIGTVGSATHPGSTVRRLWLIQ